MRSLALAERNLKEMARDPLSLGLTIGLPGLLFVVLQALEDVDPFYSPTVLAPGIALFAFVMLMFSSAMILSRDRESALFSRLLTAPLRSGDFVAAYSLPYLAAAGVQVALVYGLAAAFGLDARGSPLLVAFVLAVMALFYVALGLVFGALLDVAPLSGAYAAVLLVTVFAGTWFDLTAIGGPIEAIQRLLPFVHALDAVRDVTTAGAGLGDVAADLWWVVGYGVVVVGLALVVFRRRMLE